MEIKNIASVSIYPPIGVARVGNSDEYFLASDIPGVAPHPKGGFKDDEGRVKKQAVRFRVYAFDKAGKPMGELTAKEAKINWHIHVANIKSAWYQFINALDLPGSSVPGAYRNVYVTGKDRKQLAIKPKPKTISGKNTKGDNYYFNDGQFYDKKVNLGHVQTDAEGRLLFFGANGASASHDNLPATTFANNDGWHDDTCDGVVRAKVTIGKKVWEAKPAMVAVTPPNFGPGLFGVVTMNDVVQDLFIRKMGYPGSDEKVNFWKHIYPILERMTNTQWVNSGFFMLFGKNSPSDFTDPKLVKVLSDKSDNALKERKRVFNWFRNPESNEYIPAQIPPFYGDGFAEYEKIALVDLPITQTQYSRLKRWAYGDFTAVKPKPQKPFNKMTPAEQINALNQAPLEECLGGPFHPGIELTWPMRQAIMWESPYRLKVVDKNKPTPLNFGPLLSPAIALRPDGPLSSSGPGSLTRWMGVPWQTDEASCLSGYDTSLYLPLPSFWAARVPNQILSEDSYARMEDAKVNIAQRLKHFDYRQDWLRDFGVKYDKKINLMIAEWHELGIVTKIDAKTPNNIKGFLPDAVWKETGRHFSEEDPTLEQVIYAEKKEIQTFKAAAKKANRLLKSRAPESPRSRTRRTYGRDER